MVSGGRICPAFKERWRKKKGHVKGQQKYFLVFIRKRF